MIVFNIQKHAAMENPTPGKTYKETLLGIDNAESVCGVFAIIQPGEKGGAYHVHSEREHLILIIKGDAVRRDLPVDSEIEITLIIDESRIVHTKAFIPILDEEFNDILNLEKTTPDIKYLEKEIENEKDRLKEVREDQRKFKEPKTEEILNRLEEEK